MPPYPRHKQTLSEFPQLDRWHDALAARPGTISAYVKEDTSCRREMIEAERNVLFGQSAATVKTKGALLWRQRISGMIKACHRPFRPLRRTTR